MSMYNSSVFSHLVYKRNAALILRTWFIFNIILFPLYVIHIYIKYDDFAQKYAFYAIECALYSLKYACCRMLSAPKQ